MNKTVALFFVFLFIAGAAWIFTANPAFLTDAAVLKKNLSEKQITIRNTLPITVEVASTDAQRVQGLSGRTQLLDGHGLLMIFQSDENVGIWMKDMNFPIDVIWADASGKIVFIYPTMEPSSYPKVYSAGVPVRYVLEVPAGFTEIHNIAVGDSMQL